MAGRLKFRNQKSNPTALWAAYVSCVSALIVLGTEPVKKLLSSSKNLSPRDSRDRVCVRERDTRKRETKSDT